MYVIQSRKMCEHITHTTIRHIHWHHVYISRNLTGVVVNSPGKEQFVCRAKLLFVIADLPAKASVLNCNQFNGRFGCSTCEHEGKQVSTSEIQYYGGIVITQWSNFN